MGQLFSVVWKFTDGEQNKKIGTWDEVTALLRCRTPAHLVESVSIIPIAQHVKED